MGRRNAPLSGRLSNVVRVDDTVRRPAGPWTPSVHAILKHLETIGYLGAPRALGIDESGREVLSFVPGDVPVGNPLPDHVWTSDSLRRTAGLLRGYHQAAIAFGIPPDTTWQIADAMPADREIVCHNDIAPWNTVFRDGSPSAFIDWDLAGPGRRIWDVAYALWHFVPLYDDERCLTVGAEASVEVRSRRVAAFCENYALCAPSEALAAVVGRQARARERIWRLAEFGNPAFKRLWHSGVAEGILRDIAFVERHAATLGNI